jgi:hypothetical protein
MRFQPDGGADATGSGRACRLVDQADGHSFGLLRRLASIGLRLVHLEQEIHLPGETTIRLAVITTVLLEG